MLIIPAIDLKDGECVRLRQGRMDDSTVFSDDPVSIAAKWVAAGTKRLHLVDLNGAFDGKPVNGEVVTAIAKVYPNLPIQIGGGIRSMQTIEAYLEAGVEYLIIGTKAVKDPAFVSLACKEFEGHIIVGLDAQDGLVATDGWAEVSDIQASELAKRFEQDGVSSIVYTDIARDGMMQGVNVEQTLAMAYASSIPIIASGGITNMDDIKALCEVSEQGILGAITGRAIYEGTLDVREAQSYCDVFCKQIAPLCITNCQRLLMGLAKRIIPCLDVDKGRVVKGVQFVDIRDAGDPVEVAKKYNEQGADEITFLDITASHEGRDTMVETVERMADQGFIPLTVGGGIRELSDIRIMLNAGADKIAINSAAIFNPEFVREAAAKFGSQCIVIAIDAKRVSVEGEPPRWEIFTHGGRKPTGIDAIEWAIKMAGFGAGEILLTSMDRDGTKDGFDLELVATVSDAVAIPVIASGGVGNLQHLVEGITEGHADAVLAASIFHFGEYTVGDAKRYMAERGIEVRV